MGIKTFCSKNREELDKSVNDFMAEQGFDCAVRTNPVVSGDSIYYVATVFFNLFKKNGETKKSVDGFNDPVSVEQKNGSFYPESIGALWIQTTGKNVGKITGKLKGKFVELSNEMVDSLKESESINIKLFGMDVEVKKNPNKNQKTHPDFWIYEKK